MAALQVLALDTATPQIRAPGAGDTYAAPRALAVTANPANTSLIAGSGYSLTGSDSTPMLDFSGTWNTSGTPTALRLNVTDTASNAASNLLDLRVGGSSRFSVSKTGVLKLADAGYSLFSGAAFIGFTVSASNTNLVSLLYQGVRVSSINSFSWASSNDSTVGADLALFRDAANTLAQRNATNAQTFRIYNTFTDSTNFERLGISWTANDAIITTERAGTGSQRPLFIRGQTLYLGGAQNSNHWRITSGGDFIAQTDNVYDVGASGTNRPRDLFLGRNLVQVGAYHEMEEMTAPAAPAANKVRIYAEDNGSGKTRLMALFPTGAAQQIAIEP